MGSQVTVIEGLPHLVPNEDEAISKQLERAFRKRKITFRTNTMFESVERHNGGVTVRTQDGKTHEAEVLLVAVGRGPATANLGYEEVGVAMDRGFVLADEFGRTNVPGVWAVGDIVPGVQLAHRGFAQGIVVAEKIAGLDPTPVDDVLVPKVTFCDPEIASVGLSEAKAAEIHGKDSITTAEFNVAGNAKSQILGTQGFVKLVSLKDGPILGFHAIGARMGGAGRRGPAHGVLGGRCRRRRIPGPRPPHPERDPRRGRHGPSPASRCTTTADPARQE